MPGTTPNGIQYPVVGDQLSPLANKFATLASTADAAITTLRNDLETPDLPVPITSAGAPSQAITATAWADMPNIAPITLTLPQACWVQIAHYGWIASSTGDTRASSTVSGATTLSELQTEVGGPATVWGIVMYNTTGSAQAMGTRVVRLNAGTNTIKMRAYKNGTGTHAVNYSALQVTPLRWA